MVRVAESDSRSAGPGPGPALATDEYGTVAYSGTTGSQLWFARHSYLVSGGNGVATSPTETRARVPDPHRTVPGHGTVAPRHVSQQAGGLTILSAGGSGELWRPGLMIGTIWLDSPGFYVSAAYECWYVGQSDTVAAYGPGCPAFGTLGGGTLFGAPIYSEEPGTPGIVQLSIPRSNEPRTSSLLSRRLAVWSNGQPGFRCPRRLGSIRLNPPGSRRKGSKHKHSQAKSGQTVNLGTRHVRGGSCAQPSGRYATGRTFAAWGPFGPGLGVTRSAADVPLIK